MSLCGVLQERELDGEKKPCRKCEEKIPVNSNYCPYCAHDQAIFEYRETPRETEEDKAKITPEPKLEKDAQDLAELIDQIRAENEKYLAKRQADAKAAQEKRTFGKNENPEPNLIASTKLMLRDTFRTDKRMGRADFWWGYLGITMLTVLLTFPPCAYCPNLAGGGTGFCDDGNGDYGLFFDVFLYFRNVYGFDQTFSGC